MTNFTIHHSAPSQSMGEVYYKRKIYSPDEYIELLQRKRKIKDCLIDIVFIVVIIFRAYVFLKFGH